MEQHINSLSTLLDPHVKDDARVKTLQEINEHFEVSKTSIFDYTTIRLLFLFLKKKCNEYLDTI